MAKKSGESNKTARKAASAHEAGAKQAGSQSKPTRAERKKAAKQTLSKSAKIILVVIGVAAMLLSVTAMACSGIMNQAQNKTDYKLTGGVAATVNGVNIKEDTITKQIMGTREQAGKSKDADWAEYLLGQGMTPESYRESIIRSYANQLLLSDAEKEYKIEVEPKDLDKAWDEAVKSYGGDEKTFEDMLKQMGMDKDSYLEGAKSQIAQQKLKDTVAPVKKVTDEDIVAYVNDNLTTFNDARRSSHVLIKLDEGADEKADAKAKKKAQEALDKINAGEITFEEAAKKYSDDGSADKGGDVGWDKLTTFVPEYQDALSALAKDQVSGLVKSQFGYHIIKCTDLFHVDGKVTSIDQVPKDIRDMVKTQKEQSQQGADYAKWLADYTDKADIKINEMPSEVPYNVDMSKAKPAAESGSAAE